MTDVNIQSTRRVVNKTGGSIYGLAFLGSIVYYLSHATGFWNGAWGIIKALLWPAFLVYRLLQFLKA